MEKCCKYLSVESANADNVVHQLGCSKYTTGMGADELRQVLRGVELGTWADHVLMIHKRSRMTSKPKVIGSTNDVPEEYRPSPIVLWKYRRFELVMSRGFANNLLGNKISVYAVQKIMEANNDKKPGYHTPKPSKRKAKSGKKGISD